MHIIVHLVRLLIEGIRARNEKETDTTSLQTRKTPQPQYAGTLTNDTEEIQQENKTISYQMFALAILILIVIITFLWL